MSYFLVIADIEEVGQTNAVTVSVFVYEDEAQCINYVMENGVKLYHPDAFNEITKNPGKYRDGDSRGFIVHGDLSGLVLADIDLN